VGCAGTPTGVRLDGSNTPEILSGSNQCALRFPVVFGSLMGVDVGVKKHTVLCGCVCTRVMMAHD
jgi:hypothetical protein